MAEKFGFVQLKGQKPGSSYFVHADNIDDLGDPSGILGVFPLEFDKEFRGREAERSMKHLLDYEESTDTTTKPIRDALLAAFEAGRKSMA